MGTSSGKGGAPKLIGNASAVYGPAFQGHLLQQYKLYVESAEKVSEKRISSGNSLLTVCSALLTAFGIASSLHIAKGTLVVIPVAGLLVCVAWFSLVTSYKNLNTAKFKVIHELEEYLPAALFRYEWHACDQGKGKAYTPITHLERVIPLIFAGVFLALAISIPFFQAPGKSVMAPPASVSGPLDVNVKTPRSEANKGQPGSAGRRETGEGPHRKQ
jgi:hypothetical protein